jgi:hypothetical protein
MDAKDERLMLVNALGAEGDDFIVSNFMEWPLWPTRLIS